MVEKINMKKGETNNNVPESIVQKPGSTGT